MSGKKVKGIKMVPIARLFPPIILWQLEGSFFFLMEQQLEIFKMLLLHFSCIIEWKKCEYKK